MLSALLNKVKKALRNPNCSHCGQPCEAGSLLCPPCRSDLGMMEAEPLPQKGAATLWAATRFNPKVKQLLYPYKFYNRHHLATTLSDVLVDYWQQHPANQAPSANTVVLPIPSRWRHNPVDTFARRFASEFGYAYNNHLLRWQRDTVPQHTITGKRRRYENLHQSMAVDLPTWEQLIADKVVCTSNSAPPIRLIVVDDMTTSGATLQEAVRAIQSFEPFDGEVIPLALTHVPLVIRPLVIGRQLS